MKIRSDPPLSLRSPIREIGKLDVVRLLALLLFAGGLASFLACQPGEDSGWEPFLKDTNILLIVVDTLGAPYVGALAAELATGDPAAAAASPTPHLDQLANDGVLFRRAYSTASWTQPALASLLTGKMPSDHGLTRLFDVLDEKERSLPEHLKAKGYATAAVVGHDLLAERYGFGQGFDWFDESSAIGHSGVTSERITDLALNWLGKRKRRKPFFLMAHYFDPHFVYQHHPDQDRTSWYRGHLTPGMGIWNLRNQRDSLEPADLDYLRGLYQEEIAHTDRHIGRLLDNLEAADPNRPTLVIVTADHGEEFMEHGWIGHTQSLYDELLHVPLILHLPTVLKAAEVEFPVSLVDIVPTVLAGLDSGTKSRTPESRTPESQKPESQKPLEKPIGKSLWPLLTADKPGDPRVPAADGSPGESRVSVEQTQLEVEESFRHRKLLAEVSFEVGPDKPDHQRQKVAFATALFSGELKMIHDLKEETWQLFDRSTDPGELAPLPSSHPQFRDLQGDLLRWERSRGGESPQGQRTPSSEELDRLRSLGYLR